MNNLPKQIKKYDLLPSSFPTDLDHIDEARVFFTFKPQGCIEECLITYDNHYYRFQLRFSGRGDELHLVASHYELMYMNDDYPVSATDIEKFILPADDMSLSIQKFLDWMKEKI